MKFVCLSKTNKDKSTEIFSPLLLKPTNICAHVQCREPKRIAKGSNFKEDLRDFPSRSYYSMHQLKIVEKNQLTT